MLSGGAEPRAGASRLSGGRCEGEVRVRGWRPGFSCTFADLVNSYHINPDQAISNFTKKRSSPLKRPGLRGRLGLVLHRRVFDDGSAGEALSAAMGVGYHAHACFLDRQGNRITVPAPVHPQTPAAPWWYDWIATNPVALRRAGCTAILYPPVCKTQSGHFNTGDGYGAYDQYDIGAKNQMGSVETRFVSRDQLQRSIAVAHSRRLNVYRRGVAPADWRRQRGLSVSRRQRNCGHRPLPKEPGVFSRPSAAASGRSATGGRFPRWRRVGAMMCLPAHDTRPEHRGAVGVHFVF